MVRLVSPSRPKDPTDVGTIELLIDKIRSFGLFGSHTQEGMTAASAVAGEANDTVGSRDLLARRQPKNTAAAPVPKSPSNSRRLNNWTAVVFLAGRVFIGSLEYHDS
jgi:hypothetical protein